MKKKHLIYLLGIFILFYACSSSSTDDVSDPDPNPTPNPSTKVTYESDIKGIISGNCLSCHGATPANGAPNSLNTYNLAKGAINNIIDRINRTGAGKMPPNSTLSASAKSLIQKWKDDGLLEN